MRPAALDATDHIVLCFQSYVVRTPHHTILVDSCVGNDKPRPDRLVWDHQTDRRYMDGLAGAGLRVEDIDFVLCTHLHPDHVGWNTRLESGRWVPTFPNARYLFSEKELAYWTEKTKLSPVACIEDSVRPIVAARRADLVTSTHELGDHLRLPPTLARWEAAMPAREPMSHLVINMYALDGPPRITHIWPYAGVDERLAIRANSVTDGIWPPKGGPEQILGGDLHHRAAGKLLAVALSGRTGEGPRSGLRLPMIHVTKDACGSRTRSH